MFSLGYRMGGGGIDFRASIQGWATKNWVFDHFDFSSSPHPPPSPMYFMIGKFKGKI